MPLYDSYFPASGQSALQGTDARFPIRRIFCVASTRGAAREMATDPTRDAPFLFTKTCRRRAGTPCTPLPPPDRASAPQIELVISLAKRATSAEGNTVSHDLRASFGID